MSDSIEKKSTSADKEKKKKKKASSTDAFRKNSPEMTPSMDSPTEESSTEDRSKVKSVNLRWEREKRKLTIKDISIQTGIPLDCIEALEKGIVPREMRGKKLLQHKQNYLAYLGFPIQCSLQFGIPEKERRGTFGHAHGNKNGTQVLTQTGDIEPPSTFTAIVVGCLIALVFVGVLKLSSTVMDDTEISVVGVLDSIFTQQDSQEENTILAEKTSTDSAPASTSSMKTTHSIEADLSDDNTNTVAEQHAEENAEPAETVKKQLVKISAIDQTHVELICDGQVIHQGKLDRHNEQTCEYTEEVSVDIQDISRAEVSLNGTTIKPMGPQISKRRLVFR